MIKLTDIINELGINSRPEFYKFKKGGEYLVTYDLGDEEPYHLPLKIISIDSGGCCIAMHMHRNNIDYNNPHDIENFGFTLCKDDVIKVEKYTSNKLNELGINKTSLFNRLEEDKDYLISWDDNGTIQTEKIKVLEFDSDEDGKWVNIQILSNVKKWNKILGFEGDLNQTPWIQLFPEDLISLKPLNDLNELGIGNNKLQIEKVLEAWEKLVEKTWDINTTLYGKNTHSLLFKYGYNYSYQGVRDWINTINKSTLQNFYNDIINEKIDD